MWSGRGNRILESRLAKLLRKADAQGPFLQVGTLVDIPKALGPHYVFTDMTITQAHGAGQFSISQLDSGAIEQAIHVQRRVLERAAHVFVFSNWARDAVLRDFEVPPERISTVYAGANVSFSGCTRSSEPRQEVLFVGIDWQRKGGPLLLDAFALVRQALPGAILRIIGCTPEVTQPGVLVEGFLSRRNPKHLQRLKDCYLNASCFCLPSLFDPFPIAILEASAAGLPTVAIDNGSRRETIIDGVTGYLVPEATPERIAEALVRLLSQTRRAAEMGAAARTHCERHFTWDAVVGKLAQVIFDSKRSDQISNPHPSGPVSEWFGQTVNSG